MLLKYRAPLRLLCKTWFAKSFWYIEGNKRAREVAKIIYFINRWLSKSKIDFPFTSKKKNNNYKALHKESPKN